MAKRDDIKLLATLRERYKKAVEADQENRRRAIEDMKFAHVPGEQWDANVRSERTGEGGRAIRPMLEFNRLRVTCKRVINQMRAQRPSGKVRPTEDADKPTAEALEGLCRNIWQNSDGDSVIDTAAEYQVTAGMGAWRVSTKYSRDDAWEQDVAIEPIHNPFCLYADPSCRDPVGRDSEYWFLTTRISRDAYEAKYGKAEVVDFEGDSEFDDEEWADDDSVRLVEYWYREPVQETLLLLSDGRSIRESELTPEKIPLMQSEGVTVVKSRPVQTYAIKMCIASGKAILERADWAGSQFPFVRVFGEQMVIDGEHLWWGLVRHSRDPQKAYNYSRTAMVEAIATSPTAKAYVTPKQISGLESAWAEAHKRNYPYLPYNPDPQVPGPPAATQLNNVPAAWVNEMQFAAEDIKATSGIFDPSLGAQSNETSGIAIRSRALQGEIATYNYGDNLGKGIRRTWELLLDLIPHVYDTQRNIRTLGIDGAEKYLTVNDGLTDLSRGKYDVAITSGPSFTTQRQEAAEVYMGITQANPQVMGVAGDLIFKSMDLPYAEQIADRMKVLLPPQIQQMEADGAKADPQVMLAMSQVEQAAQQVAMQGQAVQQAAAETEQKGAEVQKAISDLEMKRSQFEAQVAKTQAEFIKRDADFTMKQAQAGADEGSQAVQSDREALSSQVTEAVAQIQAQAAQFMVEASKVIAEMQARTQPQVVVADPPKTKQVVVERIGGRLVGTIVETQQVT